MENYDDGVERQFKIAISETVSQEDRKDIMNAVIDYYNNISQLSQDSYISLPVNAKVVVITDNIKSIGTIIAKTNKIAVILFHEEMTWGLFTHNEVKSLNHNLN